MSNRVPVTWYPHGGISGWLISPEVAFPLTFADGHPMGIFWADADDVEDSMGDPTLFTEEPPAKTSQWLDAVKAWMENEADCSGSSLASLMRSLPTGSSGRTLPALCRVTTAPTSLPCCGGSPGHSPTCPMSGGAPQVSSSDRNGGRSGGCWTLNTSEWPNDAAVCSLSQALEANPDRRYFLSPRACAGILRRAEKRGNRLPEPLDAALRAVAGQTTPTA